MKKRKNIIILCFFIAIFIFSCSNSDVEDSKSQVNYEIVLVDDVNVGNVIRETIHIVVDGEYTLDELNTIAEKEALKYVKENKVNALAVGFYTDEDNIGKGYDMGRVEYVPYGNWAKAMEVKSGDYSNFEFVNYLNEPIN